MIKVKGILYFGITFAVLSGCALEQELTATDPSNTEFSSLPANQYYYFTEAQIEKKKGNIDNAIELMLVAIKLDPNSIYLQRELALLYTQRKDTQSALRVIETILQKKPNDIDSLILYGKLKQAQKKYDEAKQTYEKILRLDSTKQDIYLMLGGLYLQENNNTAAMKVFQRLIEAFPESYAGHLYLGKIYAKQGKYSTAEQELNKAIKIEPDMLEPQFELIEIFSSRSKTKDIVALYESILEKHPHNIRAALALGYLYDQNGQKEKAQKLFSELGKRSRTEFNVVFSIIQLYIDQKKYEQAIVILENMLIEVPESSDLHHIAGVAYYGIKDTDKALDHLKAVKSDSRFYQDAALHVAFLYEEKGKVDDAIAYLEKLTRRIPDNTEFLYYLGTFYEEKKQYEKAEKTLKQAIEIAHDDTKFFFRLGVVYDKWGRKDISIETMKKVIEIDPKHANALNYLGYTYADLGKNLDEAERLIKEALKYKPNDGYITDSLGWVYYQKGDYQKALKYLKKAVDLVPDDPIILEHLGDAYLKTNNEKNALKYYKRSLENKKEDKEDLEKKIQQISERL